MNSIAGLYFASGGCGAPGAKGDEYQLYAQLTLEFWPEREKGRVRVALLYASPLGPALATGVGDGVDVCVGVIVDVMVIFEVEVVVLQVGLSFREEHCVVFRKV